MGVWGDGIFDSDQSRDFTWTVIQHLIKEIQSGLYLLVARQDDYYDSEYRVIPAIRLMFVILQDVQMSPPDADIVKKWKQIFFDNLNPSRIDGGDEPFLSDDKLYQNFEKAFDDLIQFAEDWEKGYQAKIAQNKKQKEDNGRVQRKTDGSPQRGNEE
jgi:hypothetical protein